MKAKIVHHRLEFIRPAGTSRGTYKTKDTWFILVNNDKRPKKIGIGECSPLKGLSFDDCGDYEYVLQEVVNDIDNYKYWLKTGLREYPSIRFGLEMAIKDLRSRSNKILFHTPFTEGTEPIPINGLIWMGNPEYMREQIREKVNKGVNCIKMKIGAISWNTELQILKEIRNEFSKDEVELRVDANGAFAPANAMERLEDLAKLDIHSIEQPIQVRQWDSLKRLIKESPIPIALDEELIGIFFKRDKRMFLDELMPQYIIIKPSLIGGFKASEDWIKLAEERNIGWWVTSALESNIGLNAIAQWARSLNPKMVQGLGTGSLYANNIPSPLEVDGNNLWYRREKKWDINTLL